MFGGIVETTGIIKSILDGEGCRHFSITPAIAFNDLNIGDSVAINGVCLTVTKFQNNIFDVSAVPETLRLTNLGKLSALNEVNLERSLKSDSRIGGHYVQGHVDGLGQIMEIQQEGQALLVKISVPAHLAKYLVNKGYITLDGMSITIIQTTPEWLTVTFIPHTQQVTIVRHYQPGAWINIEVDILGKYVEKLLQVKSL